MRSTLVHLAVWTAAALAQGHSNPHLDRGDGMPALLQERDTRSRAQTAGTDDRKATTVTNRATGAFDVKLTPLASEEAGDGASLGRMSIDKQYRGDLQGTARGEMLTGMTGVEGSAVYVAVEHVSGTLSGRRGTFILHHRGIMTRGAPDLTIAVVPDSGTGALTGLEGRMELAISDGKHTYVFEYSLPAR